MTYRPATRADLVPGAVFVVREVHRWQTEYGIANGDRLVLTQDDGTDCPYFDKEGGAGRHLCFALEQLERIHPPAADTVAIPREVAREFVRAHYGDGAGKVVEGCVPVRATLRAALLSADPTLLDPPPPTPDEVAAARLVIERAGMRVVS